MTGTERPAVAGLPVEFASPVNVLERAALSLCTSHRYVGEPIRAQLRELLDEAVVDACTVGPDPHAVRLAAALLDEPVPSWSAPYEEVAPDD